MHVPRPENETVFPLTEQTPLLEGSVVNVTASPDMAVAETMYGGSFLSTLPGVDVNVIVCEPLPTANDLLHLRRRLIARVAGLVGIHDAGPDAVIETAVPAIEQTPALPGAMLNVTASPELAVAATVYAESPTPALPGAVEVNVIVCDCRPTANDCCTCGAAR